MWQEQQLTGGCVWGHIKHVLTFHSDTIILTTANTHLLEGEDMWENIEYLQKY